MVTKDKFEHWLNREAREEARDAVHEHRERNGRDLRLNVIPPKPTAEPPPATASADRRDASQATPPVQVLSASIGALAPELATARDVTPLSLAGKLRKLVNRLGEETVLLYYRFYFLSAAGKRWVVGSAMLGMVFAGYGLVSRAQHRAHLAAKHQLVTEVPRPHAAAPEKPPVHAAAPAAPVKRHPAAPEKRRPAAKSHARQHHGKAAKKKKNAKKHARQ